MTIELPKSRLGKQQIETTRLAFGCASLPDDFSTQSQEHAHQLLTTVWDAGMRYFDTAPHYGLGYSEQHLGAFLRTKPRDSYVLSTKVGRIIEEHADGSRSRRFDYSLDALKRSIADSQERLGIERFDIVYVHDIDCPQQGNDIEGHWADLDRDGFAWLSSLRANGTIRSWGLGVNYVDPCLRVLERYDPDLFLLANQHSLLRPDLCDTLFAKCSEQGVGIVLGAVFESGILATGAVPNALFSYELAPEEMMEQTRKIENVCDQFGVKLTAAALQFAQNVTCIDAVLIASSKEKRFLSNLEDLRADIPREFWTALEDLGIRRR